MSAPLSIYNLPGWLRRRFRFLLFVRNPGHHSPQFFADCFDRMFLLGLPQRREFLSACLVLRDPLFRERTVLNPRQNVLHLLARFIPHHLVATGEIAVFRRV